MSLTFFFSDIEDSTGLLGRLGDGYTPVLGGARALLRRAVVREAGREVDYRADEHFCVFDRPEAGTTAALAVQRPVRRMPGRTMSACAFGSASIAARRRVQTTAGMSASTFTGPPGSVRRHTADR